MQTQDSRWIHIALFLLAAIFLLGSVELLAEEERTGQGSSTHHEAMSSEPLEPQIAFPGEFDLEACEQDCRSKFGIDPYFMGGGGLDTSVWRLFTICIQDCNRSFWKDYDRRMKKLGDAEKEDE